MTIVKEFVNKLMIFGAANNKSAESFESLSMELDKINKKYFIKENWAKAVNDPENKPYKDKMYGNKVKGKINGKHYVMYNAIRGLPLERGFISNSDAFNLHIADIKRDRHWAALRNNNEIVFPFGLSEQEFKEKWDEALRIYSSS